MCGICGVIANYASFTWKYLQSSLWTFLRTLMTAKKTNKSIIIKSEDRSISRPAVQEVSLEFLDSIFFKYLWLFFQHY